MIKPSIHLGLLMRFVNITFLQNTLSTNITKKL